jgi:hypothetical protein
LRDWHRNGKWVSVGAEGPSASPDAALWGIGPQEILPPTAVQDDSGGVAIAISRRCRCRGFEHLEALRRAPPSAQQLSSRGQAIVGAGTIEEPQFRRCTILHKAWLADGARQYHLRFKVSACLPHGVGHSPTASADALIVPVGASSAK